MFKVHKDIKNNDIFEGDISKHFMFKVHLSTFESWRTLTEFQNISCLRFMIKAEIPGLVDV